MDQLGLPSPFERKSARKLSGCFNLHTYSVDSTEKTQSQKDDVDVDSGQFYSNAEQKASSMYDELREPENINLVGGHVNQIKIESADILTKKTTFHEAWEYHTIFNLNQDQPNSAQTTQGMDQQSQLNSQNKELKTFIPNLYDIVIKPKVKHMDTIEEEQEAEQQNQKQALLPKVDLEQMKEQPALLKQYDLFLKLENLMNGRENASIIDIKMGTSTITRNIDTEKRLQKRIAKDNSTTSAKLGLKIIGYVIKSRQKKIEEKFYKWPYKTQEEISVVIQRLFSWPKCDDENTEKNTDSFSANLLKDNHSTSIVKSSDQKPQQLVYPTAATCTIFQELTFQQLIRNQRLSFLRSSDIKDDKLHLSPTRNPESPPRKSEMQNSKDMPTGINHDAVETILAELERLEDFLLNRSQRDIKGASILILVDHFSQSYGVKMIDLSTIKIYDDPKQRDTGLILGVQNLIKFITKLKQ